ncbi:MAG: gluconate 2-dehydrogenase subunit 3 family protein [Chlorobi bacterium]|nr:gluconate 2-dehydrogenase subunit 3 family protein [Chlorobiota bacterium]
MKKQQTEKKTSPKVFKDTESWRLSRKTFLKSVIMGGALSQLPWMKAFGSMEQKLSILSEKQLSIISSVQQILFPAGDNGPGASDIHATEYLLWVMADPEKDPEEVQYIISGIGWVDETAEETFSKSYTELTQSEKEKLIETIAPESWGESWLSVLLTFIFEALLSDPQYGGNPDGTGWKWLNFIAGQPRPTPELLYPEIIKTIRKT